MENVSKALLIAAGILIGIIILTMLIFGYNEIASYYKTKEEAKNFEQLQEANQQFTRYNRDDIRGTELITLVNKVIDYNKLKNEEIITISIKVPDRDDIYYLNYEHAVSNGVLLIKKDYTYTASEFGEQVLNKALAIESKYDKYAKGMANELANNILTLVEASNEKRIEYLKSLNLNDSKVEKNDILKYKQYVEFKRLHFKCDEMNFDDLGRVTHFKFSFNGKKE